MLDTLLRKTSCGGMSFKSPYMHDENSLPMRSNATITVAGSLMGGSNFTNDNKTAMHTNDEQVDSALFSSSPTPAILDHISEDLKYKLFASKKIPYNANFMSGLPSSYAFRVLIAKETGQMMNMNNYKVVFDYSTAKGSNLDEIRQSELKDYIFGSPIRSNDSSQVNKFRTIPNSGLVMITRIFYYESQHNNRLAISLCVPNILLPTISEVWSYVSIWFDQSQSITFTMLKETQLLKNGMNSACDGSLPNNLKDAFPNECENIVHLLQHKLIPCFRSISETPRLFLYPETCESFIGTWFKDIFNWIEIKDGPRLNFLPALLAKIICDFQHPTTAADTTRIVIMSGNMVVANKLIFILSGLLEPRYKGKIKIEFSDSLPHQQDQQRKGNQKKLARGTEKSSTDLSKYLSTRKGWEIPSNTNSNGVVSVSSDESLAHVIQPSSLKSNSNSLQYLSSSLSSQPGSSYGSWFNKRPSVSQLMQSSPSTKNADQWDRITTSNLNNAGSLQRTASSTSLHQAIGRGAGLTPQPSPSISEYDEFPWFGTPSSPRVDSIQNSHCVPKGALNGAPLGEVNIKRDCQRLCQYDKLEEAFNKICRPDQDLELSDENYEIIPGDSRHAAFMQVDLDYETVHLERSAELLPKYTTYLANLNYWFHLQAFPVAPDSESKVIHCMRKDLQTDHNSRTLLVSLRSREIKEITIMRNDYSITGATRHGIVQKTKKIFNNGKCGNISSRLINCIAFVSFSIKKAMTLYEDAELLPKDRDQEILKVFAQLLHYTSNR